MKRTQSLSSGLIVRQDFGDAKRPVFFQTGHEDYLYATHGGTVFLVAFRGRVYGLTCGHVFQDFEYERMFITDEKQARKGSMPAPIRTLCYPSAPTDGAVGTDIVDMCVIRFADDIVPDFFKGSAYIIDEKTVATSQIQHELLVAGVLKDRAPSFHLISLSGTASCSYVMWGPLALTQSCATQSRNSGTPNLTISLGSAARLSSTKRQMRCAGWS